MKQYLEHSLKILTDKYSCHKTNRTLVDTISRFGHQNEYDLGEGFPLMTTKELFIRGITEELLWFLRGETNIKSLVDKDVHIWDEWADENGELGPIYGLQWRNWRTFEESKEHEGLYRDGKPIDQLKQAIDAVKNNPDSRRIIVSAWNVSDIDKMALPPCHSLFQFNVSGEDKDTLDCQLYQRSCDMFLGVPFNIASYAMLTQIIAKEVNLKPGRLVHTFGDAHFYCGGGERGNFYSENFGELKERVKLAKVSENKEKYLGVKEWIEEVAPPEEGENEGEDHIPLILEQLSRSPRELPKLIIAKKPLEELEYKNFILEGYDPHPSIKGKVAP